MLPFTPPFGFFKLLAALTGQDIMSLAKYPRLGSDHKSKANACGEATRSSTL